MEVNGVLYDVPAKTRMSSIVEVKKEEEVEEEKKVEKKVEEKLEERVEEKNVEVKEKEAKKSLFERAKEQWQLWIKCLELVRETKCI